MRRIGALAPLFALSVALLVAAGTGTSARGQAVPPQSSAYGRTLTEWMQTYWSWYYGGGSDQVGKVKLLGLPAGDWTGSGIPDDPYHCVGHLDVTLKPGTPFVLPVVAWVGETYLPELGYPDDPALPASMFTDPEKATISVYVDGKPVMDSTLAPVTPFYYGPAPLDATYPAPSPYGSTGAIFAQGIGFVNQPLSVGVHTITLHSELSIPADSTILNLNVYPGGLGIVYDNSWTITVTPK